MQGAAAVGIYLNSIVEELKRADKTSSLRVGKLVSDCAVLENYSIDENTRLEFGPLSKALTNVVQSLNSLITDHFAATILRIRVPRVECSYTHRYFRPRVEQEKRDGLRM